MFGERDDVGLRDDERGVLEECSNVTLVTILDAGHMALIEKPDEIAELVLAAVASKTPR